jgi:outer membrane immunogenic protein
MKKIFLSAAAFIALAAPALAADMSARPITKAPPMVSAAGYNWTGFYTASSIGGAWYEVNGTYVQPPRDGHNSDDSSGIYGSHVGIQYQWSNWVIGVEGAYHTLFNGDDWGSTSSPSADCIGSGVAGSSCQGRVRNYWTVGGKLGMTFGNWMIYGTGGFANGRVQTRTLNTTTTPNALIDFTSERHDGWFAGVGADLFVTKFLYSDLIIGVEYQHVEFDTERHFDLTRAAVGVNAFTRDVDANVDVVRAKATFKWTPGG